LAAVPFHYFFIYYSIGFFQKKPMVVAYVYYAEFMEKKNVIEEKSFSFALEVIRLCKILQKKRETVIANQLLKSGTSIGANIAEAQAACSAKEFSSRMSIAAREARETEYWLKLIDASTDIQVDVKESRQRASELVRILISIVKTSRDRERKSDNDLSGGFDGAHPLLVGIF